ncbi:MAG: guanylate kinase [Acidobacteriota bacterium]
MAPRGSLFIVSGPSGSGKSTVAAAVLSSLPGLVFSVSYTTRPPRGSERDGVEYHFVGPEEFQRLIAAGELLEWAVVYGNCYGTSGRAVESALAKGMDVLLDVDVQGARSVREKRPEAVSVFIVPPSFGTLRERLERRALDKHYVIEERLRIVSEEVRQYRSYDYLIINDGLAGAVGELEAVIRATRCRMNVRMAAAMSVLSSFGGVDDENS